MMDPTMIKRGGIVLSLILVVILLSVACNAWQNVDSTPTLSNKDSVFMRYNGHDVTNQDVYDRIKTMDGVSHLQNYIDQSLLADYMSDVEASEIDEKIKELTYGTTVDSEIDELSAREAENLEQNYRDTLIMNGYDPDDEDSVESFMRLAIAKEHYMREAYVDGDGEFAISDGDLESFYEDYKQGDLQTLVLRFSSASDVNNVLNRFNLVPNFDGGLGLYNESANDDIPIEDVASDGFDVDNTDKLSDAEALEYYIKMYNFIYPYRDALSEETSAETLAESDNEHFKFNQFDMQKEGEGRGGQTLLELSDYLYNTMGEAEQNHSRRSRTIGDFRFMVYELEREDVTPFEDLDESAIEALKVEYVDNLVGEQQVQEVMVNLYEEENLAIHDKKIAIGFEQQMQTDFYEETEDTDILATLDSFSITADEFFDYASERVGALYSLEVLKEQLLLNSTYFDDTFSYQRFFHRLMSLLNITYFDDTFVSNRDVFENKSDRMEAFRKHVGSDKSAFNNGAYQQYGFSPQNMDFKEFLFRAYGMTDEEHYLTTLVLETIRNPYLLDQVESEKVMDYVEEQYENYFSLKADQLLIYVDMEENFTPDDFNEYYDALSDSEQNTLESLKASLENKIEAAIDDGDSLKDIVDEYNDAPRSTDETDDDYSVWAQYKAAGLILKYENLAVSSGQQQPGQQPQQEENLTYNNTQGYVEEFVNALQDLYEDYTTPENRDKEELYANTLTTTQFGIHMIRGEKGDAFAKPSAQFDNTDGDFDASIENENGLPTPEQVALYNEMRVEKEMDEVLGETGSLDFDKMPEKLYDAVGAYASTSYGRLFNNINHSIHTIHTIQGDVAFETQNAHHTETLNTILELFERRTFPPIEDEFDTE